MCIGALNALGLDWAGEIDALGEAWDDGCPYAVLGVHTGATQKEVRTAYLQKAKQCHPDKNLDKSEFEEKIIKLTLELVMESEKKIEDADPEKRRKLDRNGRFSQESGYSSIAAHGTRETSMSQESWREEGTEAHDSGGEHGTGTGNNESDTASDNGDENNSNSNGNNGDDGDDWENAVSEATSKSELETKFAFKEAARVLASAFRSAVDAFRRKDDIVDAIKQGLSESNQMALEPGFVSRRRGAGTESTEEDQAKRRHRASAQKKVAYYFGRLFYYAFNADWTL